MEELLADWLPDGRVICEMAKFTSVTFILVTRWLNYLEFCLINCESNPVTLLAAPWKITFIIFVTRVFPCICDCSYTLKRGS